MISGFTPTWMIRATYDISPETLIQLGIKVVLTDRSAVPSMGSGAWLHLISAAY